MPVRFIIGRAGAGKTHHCISAVRSRLGESPLDGPRLLMLVPEQAALQTERALLGRSDLHVSHRAEAMGFRRLAHRILAATGTAGRRPLTPMGRTFALRYLLVRLAPEMVYYRRIERWRGLLEHLSRTIGEMFDEAVGPDDLAEAAARSDDGFRARKLTDLHRVYQAYLDHLGNDKLDPSQFLALAERQLPKAAWLSEAEVWVDGFAGFTRQESLLLAELSKVAGQVQITVMADPQQAVRAAAAPADLDRPSDALFGKTVRTFARMRNELLQQGVEIAEPLLLEPADPPRFANAQLARLERAMATGRGAEDSSSSEPPAVELVQCADRRVEVDYAVSRIVEWMRRQQDPLRCRDMAIIVRDLEPYHDLLSAALSARNVPFFIDRRRSTAYHPLVELIRGLVAMVVQDMSAEAVRCMLKSGLVGLEDNAADELENFILAHGVEGWDLWTGEDWRITSRRGRVGILGQPEPEPNAAELDEAHRVNQARRSLIEHLGDWLTFARSAEQRTGREWSAGLARTLLRLDVPEHLERWARDAQEDGDLDAAEEHRQIWVDVCALVDDLSDALADEQLTAGDLGAVLDGALSQFTLGLAPPMLDQVLVGEIERSRHPEIKAALILGFNDAVFPQPGSEGTILNDDDREYLERQGVPIGVTRRRRVLEERLLAYTALTRASERVVLTWPSVDSEGRPQRVSPFAEALRAACPGLREDVVDEPWQARRTWPILCGADLATGLALEFRQRPEEVGDDEASLRGRWNSIYSKARADVGLRNRLASSLRSLDASNEAHLKPGAIAGLLPQPIRVSISQLEGFAACPFQHFVKRTLRLRPRDVARTEPVDVGSLHHAILDGLIAETVAQGRSLVDFDARTLHEHLLEAAERVRLLPPLANAGSLARDAFIVRRAGAALAHVAQAQRETAAGGAFRPVGTEVGFGMDPDGLPALELVTPNNNKVQLRGRIDRVDIAECGEQALGVVVDYKDSPNRSLKLDEAYYGLALQLLAYLLVVAEHGHLLAGRLVRPAGAFYLNLRPRYELLQHPGEYDEQKHAAVRRFRPRGLLEFGARQHLDADAQGGWSRLFSVYVKRSGEPGNLNTSDAAETAAFHAVLENTRRTLGRLVDEMLEGRIGVAPYRLGKNSPCTWCDYRPVCRFEFQEGGARSLQTMKRTEVFDRLCDPAEEGSP